MYENRTVKCVVLDAGLDLNCSGVLYKEAEEPLSYLDTWFWIYLGIYAGLVLLAGLMSGLTMGLLSLDLMSLKVLQEGGTPKQQQQAAKILPVVSRHHLLLVTLLLANAIAVESMPLFLDRISDPITAIAVSVTAVLLFGEVLPQALCTRFGLAIGSTLTPFVYLLMFLLFPISWPISKLLDCLLGGEHSTFYRRAELKENDRCCEYVGGFHWLQQLFTSLPLVVLEWDFHSLVTLHGGDVAAPAPLTSGDVDEIDGAGADEEKLTLDEVLIIKGALDMKAKTVRCAMIPIESVFMKDINSLLDHSTMDEILASAHSRIPLYESNKSNIKGILLVKTLIKYSPDHATPFSELIGNPACCRPPNFVNEDVSLLDMLNEFQTGKCHMAMVMRKTTDEHLIEHQELVGLITLEDVIEELLQEEIIDETDVYVDVHRRIRVAKVRAARQGSRMGHSTGSSQPDPATVEEDTQVNTDENQPLLLG